MEILTIMLFGQGNDSSDNDLWKRVYAKLMVKFEKIEIVREIPCIWYGVYRNRKIGINFREMVSEETAVRPLIWGFS